MTSMTEALQARRSTRAFLPTPLPLAVVRDVLEAARWAPSGGNLQPWKVVAVAGAERDAVVALARRHRQAGAAEPATDRPVYPASLWEPYRTRRFRLGEELYALLGIPREDRTARLAQWERNYEFFGAPVGLFVIIDRRMEHAQWAHVGMFMLAIALAAEERGLATCMQESWSVLRGPLHQHFGLAADELPYCAIALGHADPAAPVNRLRSGREPLHEFVTFRGFE